MSKPTPEEVDSCLSLNLVNLSRFAEDFMHSVALFELLERGGHGPSQGVYGGVFINYRIIAARDGALNIFHFGCTLHAIRSQCGLSTRYNSKDHTENIKRAWRNFLIAFPHYEQIRHAVAHAGEMVQTPAKIKENTQKEDYSSNGNFISKGGINSASLHERKYMV